MSYFAAAVVRDAKGWTASEVDLTGAADLDEVADLLRDVDPDAEASLLFVESDDVYLAILRLDEGEDLRVFGSDAAFAEESRLGALLVGDIKVPALGIDDLAGVAGAVDRDAAAGADPDADEEPAADPDADPVGDADVLADLGVPAHRLLALSGQEGMLPADITAELCRLIGCGPEFEELREM